MEPKGILTEATFNRSFLTTLVPEIEKELSNRSAAWGQMRTYDTSLIDAFRSAFTNIAPANASHDVFYEWANAYAGNTIPQFVFLFTDLIAETLNGGIEQWMDRERNSIEALYELDDLMSDWGWSGHSAGKAVSRIYNILSEYDDKDPWTIQAEVEERQESAESWIKDINAWVEKVEEHWQASGIDDWEQYADAIEGMDTPLEHLSGAIEELLGSDGMYRQHSIDIMYDPRYHGFVFEVDRYTYHNVDDMVSEILENMSQSGSYDWESDIIAIDRQAEALNEGTLQDLESWLRRQMPMSESKMEHALLLTEASEKKKQFVMQKYHDKLIAAFKQDQSFERALPAQLKKQPQNEKEELALNEEKLKWLINQIDATDVTGKKYFEWLARLYDGDAFKFEDFYKAKEEFEFIRDNRVTRKADGTPFDISQFKTIQELWAETDKLKAKGPQMSGKEEKSKEAMEARAQAKILADDDRHLFLQVLGKKAAMYYGRNTRWCTAGSNYNQYEHYKDNLYILVDRTVSPPKKYQFWFGKYPS